VSSVANQRTTENGIRDRTVADLYLNLISLSKLNTSLQNWSDCSSGQISL